MTDRVGQQIGNYRLIRQLGRGGFADVYLGEHLYLNTKAAIKVLQTRLAESDLQSFISEARTIASLTHTRIIRVLDFGVEEDTLFLVMEYAPNGTLRERFPKGAQLPLANIVPFVKQVAEALQYAHDRRVIHRDIKPENMLLGQYYDVLLSDFGIAVVSQTSHHQLTQEVVGTAAYMAPEQLQGKPRPASDQYALGIVVYEWLTGDLPFHGTFTEVASQHLFVPPPPLRTKIPDIWPEVEEVLRVALAKDPQQRFMQIQAFATALELASLSQSYAIVAPPDNSPTVLVTPHPSTPVHPNTPLPPPAYQPNSAAGQPVQISQPGIGNILSGEVRSPQRGVSRRTVVIGLAGLVAGSAITLLALSQRLGSLFSFINTSTPTVSPNATDTPSSPTLGNTFLIYQGHTNQVVTIGWSSKDEHRIASGSEDTTVQVWDPFRGSTILTHHHAKQVYTLAWSSNGQAIVSGGEDGVLQVWDSTSNSNITTYSGHSAPVFGVAWSPDGQRIVSGSADKTAQVWNGSTGSALFTYRNHTKTVWAVAWSPNGQSIASTSLDGTIQIWDANTGNGIFTYRDPSGFPVRTVAWSPDGQYIASGGDSSTVQVWNAANGNVIYTYTHHTNHIEDTKWSPDGRRIASASADSSVQVWDAMTGQNAFTYSGHSNLVWAIAWSPDGKRIASASKDFTVRVWQAS